SKVMQMSQIEEIVGDSGLVNEDNIYYINQMWDKFIKGITDEYKTVNFSTFKVLFEQFVKKIAQPNDKEELMNKIQDITNILREQSMTVRGLAPHAQRLLDLVQTKYVPYDTIDRIQQTLNADVQLSPKRLDSLFNDAAASSGSQQCSISTPGPRASAPKPEEDEFFDATPLQDNIPLSYDMNRVGKLGGVANHLSLVRDKIMNLTPQHVKLLSAEELKQMQDILKDSSGRAQTNILKDIAPLTNQFKNTRVAELVAAGRGKTSAIKTAKQESAELFGLGVKPDNRTKKEKVVPFGVLQINLDKLHNNYLKLTYNNNNAVKEIKLTQISPTFRSLVDDILNGKKFSEFKFKKLSDDEKHIYKLMIKKARLAGEVDVRLDQLTSGAIEKLKNEWAKTFGELQAGNDAPQLVKRAKELIQIFTEKRLITRVEGLNLLLKL
ncbi:MAG: hypothetical protein ACK5XN_27970, partial [Bacteroidota bacterium]